MGSTLASLYSFRTKNSWPEMYVHFLDRPPAIKHPLTKKQTLVLCHPFKSVSQMFHKHLHIEARQSVGNCTIDKYSICLRHSSKEGLPNYIFRKLIPPSFHVSFFKSVGISRSNLWGLGLAWFLVHNSPHPHVAVII